MKKILFSIALLLGIIACSNESVINGEDPAKNAGNTVTLAIQDGSPSTRASHSGDVSTFPALDREKAVSNLYAVAFKEGVFYKNIPVTNTGGLNYKFDMQLSGTFDVYLVANPDAALVNLLNTAVVTPTQLGNLIAAQSAGENNTAAGFLMTSAKTTVTTAANTTANAGTIKLVRLSARFDILNKVPELKMTKVTFKQRATTSRLVTPFDMTGLTLTGAKTYQAAEGLTDYECIAAIYGYENVNAGATVLTLEGTYNGKPITPHDIVIKDIPVKRNHLYSIIISKEGGAVTPGENQKDKLKFDIVVNDWNEGAVLEWKGGNLINGMLSFTAAGTGATLTEHTPDSYSVTVLQYTATDIAFAVTSAPTLAELRVAMSALPAGVTLTAGDVSVVDGKYNRTYTLHLSAIPQNTYREISLVLMNPLNGEERKTIKVAHGHN